MELAKYVEHTFEALEKLEEEHRLLVASNSIAGIKPDKNEEQEFYHELVVFKDMLLKILQSTIDDIKHQGDKQWQPHFSDGV